MNDSEVIQEIIDLLNGPHSPDARLAIANRDNIISLLEELFESYGELDNRLAQINDLADY
jgi:hypothetical protein